MLHRCPWCGDDPLYVAYHDDEWGVPQREDPVLFEFLTLEGAQAGLSWITVLRKRQHYRRAFQAWDVARIARLSEAAQARLLQDPGIVRHRQKVASTVTNARAFLAVQEEHGSFADYLWGFVDGTPVIHRPRTMADVPASTPLSDTVSKDLKRRGFKFVGTTIVYAYLQAMGVVDDHLTTCFRK